MKLRIQLLKHATLLAAAAFSTVAFAQTSGSSTAPSTPSSPPATQTTPSTSSSGSATMPSSPSSPPSASMPSNQPNDMSGQLNDPATAAKHDEERLACESKAPSEQKACKDAVDARYGVRTPTAEGNADSRPMTQSTSSHSSEQSSSSSPSPTRS